MSVTESVWEKVTDADKESFVQGRMKPIVKSQFRLGKQSSTTSQKKSVQIHLYASLILFICASAPRAKISLTSEVQFNVEMERNQLVIYKNEKQIHLRLNDEDNLMKWADALEDLGIPEKQYQDEVDTFNGYSPEAILATPQISPGLSAISVLTHTDSNSSEEDGEGNNPYAAPETFKVSMEHFIINSRFVMRRATDYVAHAARRGMLERIPEEQECCE